LYIAGGRKSERGPYYRDIWTLDLNKLDAWRVPGGHFEEVDVEEEARVARAGLGSGVSRVGRRDLGKSVVVRAVVKPFQRQMD
jgi:hypothetical protein